MFFSSDCFSYEKTMFKLLMLHYFSCRLEDSVQQGSSPREAGSGAPSLLEVCAVCVFFCLISLA